MCEHEWAILHADGSLECISCGHTTTIQRIELEANREELLAAAPVPDIDWDKEFEEKFLGLIDE